MVLENFKKTLVKVDTLHKNNRGVKIYRDEAVLEAENIGGKVIK